MAGPFGRTLFAVREEGKRVSLRDAHGHRFTAEGATNLIRRVTGWRVPADDLSYWIVGSARPGIPERHTVDHRGRLRVLAQAGWTIRFSDYDRYRSIALPRHLSAVYDEPGAPKVHLRLVVDRWRIP